MHLILDASAVMTLANLAGLGAVGEDEVGIDSEDYYLFEESIISIGDPLIFRRRGWIYLCSVLHFRYWCNCLCTISFL